MLKLKGSVKAYQVDVLGLYKLYNPARIYNVNSGPNMIVETGKDFMLDEIFDNGKWNSGSGILGIATGDSTDTNAGVVGPDATTDITIAGAVWNGVSEDDWRLSSEIARSAILNVTRSDQAILAVAQFVDGQLPSDPTYIREVGLFLHATTAPTANPQDDDSQKPYAMVGRRVYYGYDDDTTPTKYVDRPYYKIKDGNPLMMEYKLELT